MYVGSICVSSVLDFGKPSTVVPDKERLVKLRVTLIKLRWRWMYMNYKVMIEGGPEEVGKRPC